LGRIENVEALFFLRQNQPAMAWLTLWLCLD